MGAAEFKDHCLAILDSVDEEGLVITKRGRPVARLVPYAPQTDEDLIGALRDVLVIRGETFSTGSRWDAESGRA